MNGRVEEDVRHAAFTLVEVLIVVSAIAVLAGVAIVTIQGAQERSRVTKLHNDVAVVNSAIALFESNGGTIPNDAHPTNIISRLKAAATAQSAATHQVASGSFVDLRLRAVMMEPDEAAGDRPRAVFDATERRFKITNTGTVAVREFRLDEAEVVADVNREGLKTGTNGWVWNYADNTPNASLSSNGSTPATVSLAGGGLRKLMPPIFSPAAGPQPLTNFQPNVQVTISNPNGGGRLFFAGNGGGRQEYTGALSVPAGATLTAWVESDDPAKWINSDVSSATYPAQPYPLMLQWDAPMTVNFLQAGGTIPGLEPAEQAHARLVMNLSGIHENYLTEGLAEIFVTSDGSDPSSLAAGTGALWNADFSYDLPIAWGDFSPNGTLVLSALAKARSPFYQDSPVATTAIAIERISLPGPTISPEAPFMLPNWMEMALVEGVHPAGSQIYYTLNGDNPINSDGSPAAGANLYTGGFNPEILEAFTVKTAVVVPPELRPWFESQISSASYVVPVGADSSVIGAVVGSGNIDGAFYGSLIFANPSGEVNFNSQGRILNGNLFLPGLPAIVIQPSPGTVVNRGAAYVPGATIPRNVIGGKEYTTEGQLANPQSDLRQIVDLAGSTEPSNYTFRFNANSYLDGKVFRRANPPTMPTVTLPTGLPSMGSVTLQNNSNPPTLTLAGGDYSSVTINADQNVIRLGVPGSTEPTTYIFRSANFNKGRIEILGPTKLYFPNGFNVSATVVGNVSDPGLLQIEVLTGSVNVNSGGTLAARLIAPQSSVTLSGIFRGTVIARELRVNGNGVAFTLPPIIEGTEG